MTNISSLKARNY